jgi:hypothetical protein
MARAVTRIGFLLLGSASVGVIVWTGFKARDDPHGWTLWFGVACALLAPAGVGAFRYALWPPDRPLYRRLAAVPEIQDLMEEAQSAQQELELVRQERARLVEIVQLESRRQTLLERREALVGEARRLFTNLEGVDGEIRRLGAEVESSRVIPEVKAIEDLLAAERRGDIVIRLRDKTVALDPTIFSAVPFGPLLAALASLFRGERRR